jgi:hypothetical protein
MYLIVSSELHKFLENKTRSITHKKKEYNPPTQIHKCIKGTYINNISNRRQQFPHPIILTPDDDHIGQNM